MNDLMKTGFRLFWFAIKGCLKLLFTLPVAVFALLVDAGKNDGGVAYSKIVRWFVEL